MLKSILSSAAITALVLVIVRLFSMVNPLLGFLSLIISILIFVVYKKRSGFVLPSGWGYGVAIAVVVAIFTQAALNPIQKTKVENIAVSDKPAIVQEQKPVVEAKNISAFNIPSLIGKSLAELKAELGPIKNENEPSWVNGKYELFLETDSNKNIVGLSVFKDSSSTEDELITQSGLVDVKNNYNITFTRHIKTRDIVGITVKPK